jgi:creatinine amidohydrolase
MASSSTSVRTVMWKELTAAELRDLAQRDATVLLPVASMEQHGPHLPVGVDTYLSEAICKAAAEALQDEMPVVVAPTLWCGLAEHHMAFGGTFTFDLPTYRAVLLSFLKSIARHGFRRVLISNGHGGNIAALSAFVPDFTVETGLKICAMTPFDVARTEIGAVLEDQPHLQHACEAETSMMMVVAPGLVRREKLAEAVGAKSSTPRPLGVARYRSFRSFTGTGVVGDARRASPEKGGKVLAICRDAVIAVVRDPEAWS